MPQVMRPLGVVYSQITRLRRILYKNWQPTIPVICIGNVTTGGTGKTPTAIAIAQLLKNKGLDVHFLSRGYGGSSRIPTQVSPALHSATQVGDEPLLLADVAPTWVSPDRQLGAQKAISAGADILVMDDGFQNLSIRKTLSIVVVDGEIGFGNSRVMPAGPLREPLMDGLERADAVLIVGEDQFNLSNTLMPHQEKGLTLFKGTLEASKNIENLRNTRVLAFAGIGRPNKFYSTLRKLGCEITDTYSFPDHHVYSIDEVQWLVQKAVNMSAQLITTTKDKARLGPVLAANILALPVHLRWEDEPAVESWLSPLLVGARQRAH